MLEAKSLSVQERAVQAEHLAHSTATTPVAIVAYNWISDRLKMHSDLVSASGLKCAREKRQLGLGQPLQNAIPGPCCFALAALPLHYRNNAMRLHT